MIDWNSFTPLSSFAGGLLIGLSASILMLLNGKVAGISGIVGELFRPAKGDVAWRLYFIGGLLVSPFISGYLFDREATIQAGTATPMLLLAGLLVGIGTRYASGCTSGHGVCGLSRRSFRSLAATGLFMTSGFIVAYIVRHLLR